MKLKKVKSKMICMLLIFALMLQSCAVYHKEAVSLDDAVASNGKVLITKTDGAKLKLKKVELIDGKYYGTTKVKGKIEKIILIKNDIRTIRIFNKTASTWGNIGITVGSLLVVLVIVAAISLQDGFNIDLGPGY